MEPVFGLVMVGRGCRLREQGWAEKAQGQGGQPRGKLRSQRGRRKAEHTKKTVTLTLRKRAAQSQGIEIQDEELV